MDERPSGLGVPGLSRKKRKKLEYLSRVARLRWEHEQRRKREAALELMPGALKSGATSAMIDRRGPNGENGHGNGN